MKKVLFIDRDGTIIQETEDQMLNEIHKIRFLPGCITSLAKIAKQLDYSFVMVTNQDDLGGETFPEKDWWPLHELILDTLKSEGVIFENVYIDRHLPEDNSPYRKPGTGMLTKYVDGPYDLENSYVIGDRESDMQLATNLGCRGIMIPSAYSSQDIKTEANSVALVTSSWEDIYSFLLDQDRVSNMIRSTKETTVIAALNIDGSGQSKIETGLSFLDHMLDQLARHGEVDLHVHTTGDLEVDEHHTVEDTAIVLGQVYAQALGKKVGIERYGYHVVMDDAIADVRIDFGGRSWIIWETSFRREKIGDLPTELFYHFFKSFSDHAKCNVYIKATGDNEHHKIEAIFKAFARAIKMAKYRNKDHMVLPSTKGII